MEHFLYFHKPKHGKEILEPAIFEPREKGKLCVGKL